MTRLPIATIIPSPWREQLISMAGLKHKYAFDDFVSDMKRALPHLFWTKEEEQARLAKLEDKK